MILNYLASIRHFCYLLNHWGIHSIMAYICKGQPFLSADQVSSLCFACQSEATSGSFSLQWLSCNPRLATHSWRLWPLVIWAYAAAYTRPPYQNEVGRFTGPPARRKLLFPLHKSKWTSSVKGFSIVKDHVHFKIKLNSLLHMSFCAPMDLQSELCTWVMYF